jgi:transposase
MVDRAEEIAALEEFSKRVKGKKEYRRLQVVLLRIKHRKSIDEIAALFQIHRRTVYKHLERYRQEGLSAFNTRKPGATEGPRLMSTEEERELLSGLETQAREGQLLTGGQVQQACEEKLGRPVGLSTVYVLLHRNGWSKQQPRPRHPKGDDEAKSLFKKTTGNPSAAC